MAINLTTPAARVDFGAAAYKPMLDTLQANILSSHGRDHARHLFIRFTGGPGAVRSWISTAVTPSITSASAQRQESAARATAKAKGNTFDGGLVTGFFLSAAGYKFLEFDADQLPSAAFRKGMKDRSRFVGPKLLLGINLRLRNRDPAPDQWEAGFRGEIHALLTLADDKVGDDLSRLLKQVEFYKDDLITKGVGTVTQIEDGRVLRRPIPGQADQFEPIEHFGYFDGISQPLFSKPDLDRYHEQQRDPRPGDWDPAASLNLILARDPFADAPDAYGSFFVYRKLEQDFDLFNQRVKALANAVPTSEELAGAYVVGRFKDGTPISEGQVPSPGVVTANHFMHDTDKDGLKCPMHAHVRKANPRGTTPLTSLKDESARRIARRAIPYGKPHPDIGCDPAQYELQEAGPRGLLFMCFQSNIEDHFEFIQRVWIDNNDFPSGTIPFFQTDTGDDPLIGQDQEEAQHWPKKWNNEPAGTEKFDFEAAVTLKGGEYFFAPSLPFLAGLSL